MIFQFFHLYMKKSLKSFLKKRSLDTSLQHKNEASYKFSKKKNFCTWPKKGRVNHTKILLNPLTANRRTVRHYKKSLGCRTDVPYVITKILSGAEPTYRTSLQKVSRVPNRRTVRHYKKSLGCRTDVPYVITKSLSGAEPTYRTSLRKSFFFLLIFA